MLRNIIYSILLIFSLGSFAQENQEPIALQQFVEELKLKNESIKNADSVNVMVNDVLIENQSDYKIDPKNISKIEILIIEPEKNLNSVKPSIIISTRIK